MALALRIALLLCAILQLSQAIPTTEATLPYVHPHDNDAKSSHTPVISSPFRRIRDAIIQSIWTVPHQGDSKCGSLHQTAPSDFRARYGDDVVLRFKIDNQEYFDNLLEASEILYLDIWEVTEEWVDIRLAKNVLPSFLGLLPQSLHNTYVPVMHDLVQAVCDTYPQSFLDNSATWRKQTTSGWSGEPQDVFFKDYQPLSVLYPWMRLLAALFPTHVTLSTIGMSAQGRDIAALRIGARPGSTSVDEHPDRPTMLITGGSHAREWISVSTATYIAYNLVTRYGDPRFPYVTKLLDHFDLVFIPTLNPDGYDYTWSTDRLWRKSRQSTLIPFCPGIDLDRSFGFAWDGNNTMDNACSEDYAGTSPLSAVESRRLAEWARNEIDNNNVTFVAFLDLHSYSQQILYPYSFSCEIEPPNLEDLEEVAIGLAKSFRLSNGHFYTVSSACKGSIGMNNDKRKAKSLHKGPRVQMDPQGGSALDFFHHELNVKYSYQIKLRDTGTYGFLLPKSNIIPAGHEAFEAVLGLGKWLLGNHGIERWPRDQSSIWGTGDEEGNQANPSKNQDDHYSMSQENDEADDYEMDLRRRRRR